MRTVSFTLILVISFTGLTSLIIGYDLCIVASVLKSITDDFKLCFSSNMGCFKRAFFVSSLPPGAVVGSLIAGIFSDLFGRKSGLILSDFFIGAGSICFYFGQDYNTLLFGRFVIGIGIGVGFVVFSMYIPEISPAKYRGAFVAAQDCALSLGCLVSYLIISVVSPAHWRELLGAVGIIAFLQLLGCIFLPESPRWLVRKDRRNEAISSMIRLVPSNSRGKPHSDQTVSSVAIAEKAVEQMVFDFEQEKKTQELHRRAIFRTGPGEAVLTEEDDDELQYSQVRTKMTFLEYIHYMTIMSWKYRRQLAVAIGCAVAQNFTLGNSFVYYSVIIMNNVGIQDDVLAGIATGLMKFSGITAAILLVDRLGRKRLLFWGSITTCLCLFLFAVLFSLKSHLAAAWTCFAIMCAYIFAWNISWAGLMFVVASEVLHSSVRGIGMGATITVFWLLAFVFQTTLEPTLAAFTAPMAFVFYGILNIFSILFVNFYVEDFTGLELEAIQH